MSTPKVNFWNHCIAYLRDVWQRTRRVVAVLAIVRFSLLIATALALTLVVADQMIDILRAVGEAKQRAAIAWLLAMTAFCALTVWYAARTMLRFRFASNPASDPDVHPRLKVILPRLLGIAIPAMLMVRVGVLAYSSIKPVGLWIFTAALAVLTALVSVYVIQRRRIAQVTGLHILAATAQEETRNLTRFRELPKTTLCVLIALITTAVVVNALFMCETFYDLGAPVALGAPAILVLGLGLTTVGGSILVYMANHYAVPIISVLLVWTVVCSINNDNHVVRISAKAKSHGIFTRATMPSPKELKTSSPLGTQTVGTYFKEWFAELALDEPPSGEPIPVFVVAAEGGGLRAAYWTAAVLALLEDETAKNPTPFSRHLFAISGVSGGSVGAALFDAAVAQRARVDDQRTDTRLEEMDLILRDDFLSDTLGAALFPDLLQRFLPVPALNDRAIALDRSFDRAWGSTHPRATTQLSAAFHDLWLTNPHKVPLLFLNSTVVETGQRAIGSPLATLSPKEDPAFADSLAIGRLIGTQLPLSTAALLSARFTYVSPAALIDTHRTDASRWIRLVDGGYFDNSGAVTAQEIVRDIIASHQDMAPAKPQALQPRAMRVIVLHLPNQPEVSSAIADEKQRNTGSWEWMSEVLAPVKTLLQTRGARGTQAVSYLRREPQVQLLSIRPCTINVAAPLGWVLSEQVRFEMMAQLHSCNSLGENCAAPRLDWVRQILTGNGTAPYSPIFDEPTRCTP
jgi:predicted acylesterase/phospholipase RssA